MKKAPSPAPRQIAPVSSSSGKATSPGAVDPATTPKTGIDRINEIMRSSPDLDELARLAKAESRKDTK